MTSKCAAAERGGLARVWGVCGEVYSVAVVVKPPGSRIQSAGTESAHTTQSWSPRPVNVGCLLGEILTVKGSGTTSAAVAPAGRAGDGTATSTGKAQVQFLAKGATPRLPLRPGQFYHR